MENMLDYILVDYLEYNLTLILFISMGVIFACAIYMAVFGINKFVGGFLIFSIIAFLFGIHYSRQQPIPSGPHYYCNIRIEREADNVAQAIAIYYSEPSRTKIPSYSELVKLGYYPLGNIDLKRRGKLFKESEFSIEILGNARDEIKIVLSSAEGKCPFGRWGCPRRFKGKYYVEKMEGGVGVWLDSYEGI